MDVRSNQDLFEVTHFNKHTNKGKIISTSFVSKKLQSSRTEYNNVVVGIIKIVLWTESQ